MTDDTQNRAPQQAPQSPDRQHQGRDNPPADIQQDGNITAATWRNEGDHGPYYTTTFTRSWQDDQGNWSNSNSFRGTDLLRLSELSRLAYARTNELREKDRESFRQARSDDGQRPRQNRERSR